MKQKFKNNLLFPSAGIYLMPSMGQALPGEVLHLSGGRWKINQYIETLKEIKSAI